MHIHPHKRILALILTVLVSLTTVSGAFAKDAAVPLSAAAQSTRQQAAITLVDHGLSLDLRQAETDSESEVTIIPDGYAWAFVSSGVFPSLALTPARLPAVMDAEGKPALDIAPVQALQGLQFEILDGTFSADTNIYDPENAQAHTRQLLSADLDIGKGWLEKNGLTPAAFVYPRGYDPQLRNLIAGRYTYAVGETADECPWNRAGEDPLALKEVVLRGDNLAQVLEILENALAAKGWLVIGLSDRDKPSQDDVSALLTAVKTATQGPGAQAEYMPLTQAAEVFCTGTLQKPPTVMHLPGSSPLLTAQQSTGEDTTGSNVQLSWAVSSDYKYSLTAENYRWVCVDKSGNTPDSEKFDGTVASAGYERIGKGNWIGGGEADNTKAHATVSVKNNSGVPVQFKVELVAVANNGVTIGASVVEYSNAAYDVKTKTMTIAADATGSLSLTTTCTGTPLGDENTSICTLNIQFLEAGQ